MNDDHTTDRPDDLPAMLSNVTFDELSIGQRAQQSRTLSADDIAAFAAVSGDVNPAHLDAAYAGQTLFHGVIAHGMWGAALISRVLGTVLPGPGTIYMTQTLRFLQPVRIGDTLRVSVTVQAKEAAKRHVELHCEIRNQHDAVVLDGVASVIAPASRVRVARAALPRLYLFDTAARFRAVFERAAGLPALRCAVIHPCDEASLKGALLAAARGLIVPLLVAPAARLRALARAVGLHLDGVRIVDVPHSAAAAERGAAMAAAGEVALLMQGSLDADELIDAVTAQAALRTGRRLSHVFHIDAPMYAKPLFISDAALNIKPNLLDKVDIVQNAIELAHALGIAAPRVAVLAAVGTVTPKLVSTLDAAALCKMAERGQISGAVLDGPLAFDDAIAPAAARGKGLTSDVAGQADILIVPDMESGSMLVKQLDYLAGAAACGVLLGAAVPIALASRADGAESRVASAALALLLAHHRKPSLSEARVAAA